VSRTVTSSASNAIALIIALAVAFAFAFAFAFTCFTKGTNSFFNFELDLLLNMSLF